MATTTFSGPVRAEKGFATVIKNTTTGAYTVRPEGTKPSLIGLTATAVSTSGTLTYTKNVITINNFTGAAAQAVTLPAANQGDIVVHAQSVDTTGGTNTLSFDCAGSDVYATGSFIESRGSSAVTFDSSAASETLVTFTPANAATNLFSIGSYLYFTCFEKGTWQIGYDFQHLGAGTTGAWVFAS